MKPPHMAAATVHIPPFTPSSLPPPSRISSLHYPIYSTNTHKLNITLTNPIRVPLISHCTNPTTDVSTISPPSQDETTPNNLLPPVKKKRKPYRRLRPGEAQGITEEMRFVAMKLRDKKLKVETDKLDEKENGSERESDDDGDGDGGDDQTWEPELDGFLRYLVDSQFVFSTIERMVDESQDVSFAYFRNSGLERSESFAKDIEWLGQQDATIPEPLFTSKKYVKYLEELAAQSPMKIPTQRGLTQKDKKAAAAAESSSKSSWVDEFGSYRVMKEDKLNQLVTLQSQQGKKTLALLEEQRELLRQRQYDHNLNMYSKSHNHLKGKCLDLVLERKEEIAAKYNWERYWVECNEEDEGDE